MPFFAALPSMSTAERTNRRSREAAVICLTTGTLYEVWCDPKRGESYRLEAEFMQAMSKRHTLSMVKQHDDMDAAYVIARSETGSRDVSEDFARMWAREDGREWIEAGDMPQFVGRHLVWDDIHRELGN